MNEHLTDKEVVAYLKKIIHSNPLDIALKKSPFPHLSSNQLAQQLAGMQIARKKFPDLYENREIIYPPKVNLEQTSSQTAASYKASRIKGPIIDLTGGFGIDCCAFYQHSSKDVTHVELNRDLQMYSEHLFKTLDYGIHSVNANGLTYLKETDRHFESIYLDPSRKTSSKSKALFIEDYEPNVLEFKELLLAKANQVWIKTSPMLDLSQGTQQLQNVQEIHIVAVKNEVKEVLWKLDKSTNYSPVIHCVNLETNQNVFQFPWDSIAPTSNYESPQTYLIEPNAAIMKSQGFSEFSKKYGLDKIDANSHLFTATTIEPGIPGRVFKIKEIAPYQPKSVKKKYGNQRFGVVTRNFKLSVQQLRQKFKLGEHETDYLFFTTVKGSLSVIQAQKI